MDSITVSAQVREMSTYTGTQQESLAQSSEAQKLLDDFLDGVVADAIFLKARILSTTNVSESGGSGV